jgi:two-component system response regulator YesN
MYRLLIVDDEPVIVEGLSFLFQQIDDIELDVCTASSGHEALEWLYRARIDIVLSDIQMPGLNGIQLMEEIKKSWPSCRVVMFTGYSDFDYVYRSIRQEGVKYLLKSEGDDVVVDTVRSLIREIQDQVKAEEWMERAEHQLQSELPLLQKEFMLDLLYDPAAADEWTSDRLTRLNIPLVAEMPILLLIARIDDEAATPLIQDPTRRSYAVKQVIEQSLSERFRMFMFSMKTEFWYILLQPSERPDNRNDKGLDPGPTERTLLTARETLAFIQRICTETLNLRLSFVLKSRSVAWKDAGSAFSSIRWLLDYRVGTESGVILSDTEGDVTNAPMIAADRLKMLEGYLIHRNAPAFLSYLENLLGTELDYQERNGFDYEGRYYFVAIYLLQVVQRWKLSEKLSSLLDLGRLLRLKEFDGYEDMLDYFNRWGQTVIGLYADEQESHLSKPVRFLETYIAAHLDQDLSLVKLAEISHFNPSYLSRLFKRVTGENLSDYINRYRIEKAIKLLENPDLKIGQVAAAVGFESVSYFNRVFKTQTGTTPQKYRERLANR